MTLVHFFYSWLIVMGVALFGWVGKIIINSLSERYNEDLWDYIAMFWICLLATVATAVYVEVMIWG